MLPSVSFCLLNYASPLIPRHLKNEKMLKRGRSCRVFTCFPTYGSREESDANPTWLQRQQSRRNKAQIFQNFGNSRKGKSIFMIQLNESCWWLGILEISMEMVVYPFYLSVASNLIFSTERGSKSRKNSLGFIFKLNTNLFVREKRDCCYLHLHLLSKKLLLSTRKDRLH